MFSLLKTTSSLQTMKKYLITILIALSSCAAISKNLEWGKISSESNAVSSIELLSSGQQFDGWLVSVMGIMYFDTEYNLLFVGKEQYRLRDTASSLGINLQHNLSKLGMVDEDLLKLNGSYVLVQGIYRHVPRKKLARLETTVGPNYAGYIEQINYISAVEATSQKNQKEKKRLSS